MRLLINPASYQGIASAMPYQLRNECRLQALRSSRELAISTIYGDRRNVPHFSTLLSLRTNLVMPDPNSSRVYFENSAPILRVDDMKAALAFYVDKLGFQNASGGTDEFTSVNRDRAGIYLCRGGQGRGAAWVWVGVEDATRLHDEFVARRVAIRMPLTNFSWALEFHVEDPDGNVLRFGSEPLEGSRSDLLPR